MTTVVHMVGNAHLDPVWLWGWQEGADEVLATFRSAADRCDEYPEFVFTAGEAWRYRQVERHDPELFERIRALVGAGRWHPTGGQVVQPDCNLPTGTALRRQLQHGTRYFMDRFGVRTRVGFNPDSFGHPATLPDLLAEAGIEAYAFHRPSASAVPLPAETFRWRGVGGAEVVGIRVRPSYVTRSQDLTAQIELALEAADPALGHAVCLYGVGDHGGGPTRGQIEYILERRTTMPGVELRFSTIDVYVDAIRPHLDALPTFAQELQRTFPGCYSVMGDVKRRQRRAELALEAAERSVAALLHGERRTALEETLRDAWEDILFTSFHDILAGTSVASAWDSVAAMQGRASITAEEVLYEATRAGSRRAAGPSDVPRIVSFNPGSEPWSGLVEVEPWIDFDDWGGRWLADESDAPVEFQLVDAESDAFMTRVIYPASIGRLGWHTVAVRDGPPPTATSAGSMAASTEHLEGRRSSIGLSDAGIDHLVVDGLSIFGADGLRLHLREDTSDTWTMTTDRFDGPVVAVLDGLRWSLVESGPLRARACAEGALGKSPIELSVTLHRDSPTVTLEIDVTVVEQFRALQLAVSLATTPGSWTAGLPAGEVERAPGATEWPVQGWVKVPCDGGFAGMVTNDAYSARLEGSMLSWTLVRTPRMAFPPLETRRRARHMHTDQGRHGFRFDLTAASSLDAGTLHRAAGQQLGTPVTFTRYDGVRRPPWNTVPPRKLWTEAERRAHAEEPGPPG